MPPGVGAGRLGRRDVAAAVVLDAEVVARVGQVQPQRRAPCVVEDRVLGHRPRETTPDEDQPEPGLGRGAGARVGPRRRVDHPSDTPGVGVPDREVQQHVRVERPAGQRVDGDDTLGRGQTPREVERGADTRGDPDATAAVPRNTSGHPGTVTC